MRATKRLTGGWYSFLDNPSAFTTVGERLIRRCFDPEIIKLLQICINQSYLLVILLSAYLHSPQYITELKTILQSKLKYCNLYRETDSWFQLINHNVERL